MDVKWYGVTSALRTPFENHTNQSNSPCQLILDLILYQGNCGHIPTVSITIIIWRAIYSSSTATAVYHIISDELPAPVSTEANHHLKSYPLLFLVCLLSNWHQLSYLLSTSSKKYQLSYHTCIQSHLHLINTSWVISFKFHNISNAICHHYQLCYLHQ